MRNITIIGLLVFSIQGFSQINLQLTNTSNLDGLNRISTNNSEIDSYNKASIELWNQSMRRGLSVVSGLDNNLGDSLILEISHKSKQRKIVANEEFWLNFQDYTITNHNELVEIDEIENGHATKMVIKYLQFRSKNNFNNDVEVDYSDLGKKIVVGDESNIDWNLFIFDSIEGSDGLFGVGAGVGGGGKRAANSSGGEDEGVRGGGDGGFVPADASSSLGGEGEDEGVRGGGDGGFVPANASSSQNGEGVGGGGNGG